MLTASQTEVVAFMDDCSIMCPDCAEAAYGERTISTVEAGLEDPKNPDLTPVIRYTMDEMAGERAGDWADEEIADVFDTLRLASRMGHEVALNLLDDLEDDLRERLCDEYDAGYPCDSCGKEID